jgi:HTH-type transcriptional regulator, transcriptional repressor of NAD biosynthesis genes
MATKSEIKKKLMRKGLVLGKFMPVHTGHVALIDFASNQCDELTIFLCYHKNEPIAGAIRAEWLRKIYSGNSKVEIFPFEYNPIDLPDSSISSRKDSNKWSQVIKKLFPDLRVLCTSEKYGEYVAEFLGIQHVYFNETRSLFSISSSQIRSKPLKFWDFIPSAVQPYFVKKIAIVGSESTGKSTLTENLANHYHTTFVSEVAREIIEHTKDCTYQDLEKIAIHHARSILEKKVNANRFLFIDTEINITKSYSKFLFNRELIVEEWIAKANQCDFYLYLEPDCPHIQDGTRLDEAEKLKLHLCHKEQSKKAQVNYISIAGNWEERFTLACEAINKIFLS